VAGAVEREGHLAAIDAALLRIGRTAHGGRAARSRRRRSKVALQPTSFALLDGIGRLGPVRLADVARDIGLEPSRASREATQLAASGLLTQTADPDDARAALLELTAEGQDVRARYAIAVVGQVGDWFDGWSDRDVARLAALLDRLAGDARIDDW
jgi:DNA-binding MarR family transcriptional regulator